MVRLLSFSFIVIFVCTAPQMKAQSVVQSVVGNGGSVTHNTQAEITATIGQGIISPTTASDIFITQGFWHSVHQEDLVNTTTVYSYSDNFLRVNPHPVHNTSTISYTAKEYGPIRIELYTVVGEFVKTLFNEPHQGLIEIPMPTENISSGQYTLRVTTEQQQQSILIVVQK